MTDYNPIIHLTVYTGIYIITVERSYCSVKRDKELQLAYCVRAMCICVKEERGYSAQYTYSFLQCGASKQKGPDQIEAGA